MAKIKPCGNCCEKSSDLVSTIFLVKNEVGDGGDGTNISISAGLSSLFSFWLGSPRNAVPGSSSPLEFCPKCATIFQEMYKISIQFQSLGGNGSQISNRLKILREEVAKGQGTKSTEGTGQMSMTPKNVVIRFDPEERDDPEQGQIKEEPLSGDDEPPWMGEDGEIFGDHDQFASDPLQLCQTEENDDESTNFLPLSSDFVDYPNPGDLQCSICLKKFVSVFENVHHFRQVHDKNCNPLECQVDTCGESFQEFVHLKSHMEWKHPGVSFPQRKRPTERRGANGQGKINLDERSAIPIKKDNAVKKLPCSVCGKEFRSPALLNTHLITHTDQKNHPCPKCGKRFRTPGNLKNHDLLVHIKERKIACPICGASFVRKSHLEKHVASLHEQPRFACDTCGKSYPREDSLNVHMKIHSAKDAHELQCPICSKFFGRKSSVKLHMRKFHPGVNNFDETGELKMEGEYMPEDESAYS